MGGCKIYKEKRGILGQDTPEKSDKVQNTEIHNSAKDDKTWQVLRYYLCMPHRQCLLLQNPSNWKSGVELLLAEMFSETTSALQGILVSFSALQARYMQFAKTSCRAWVDALKQVKRQIEKREAEATELVRKIMMSVWFVQFTGFGSYIQAG